MEKFNHTDSVIYHGDTFDGMAKLADNSVDMLLVDLPYGITTCNWDAILPLNNLWDEYNRIMKENGAMIFTASQPFTWMLCASNSDNLRYTLVWEKPNGTNPMLVDKQPFKVHEDIVVFYRKQPTYNPQMTYGHDTYLAFKDDEKLLGEVYTGGKDTGPKSRHKENTDGSRYPRSVQKFAQDRSGHPTKKPVDLFRWLIRTYSNPGDVILDNTIGEGTTAIAALLEGRKIIGIEKEQNYVDKMMYDITQTTEEIKYNDGIYIGNDETTGERINLFSYID